jgi:DNA gyrase subunit B
MATNPKKPDNYGDQSITMLKGADRVRLRPAVIFGSDGLEGCQHSFFEILANAVDEAREGYGDTIIVTAFSDKSIEVEDFGRGVPLGYNEKEQRYNWELVYCELYAGGKYETDDPDAAYEYSLGLNGLGACATQYSSEYMTVKSYNGRQLSEIDFKAGEVASEFMVRDLTKSDKKKTGTVIRWKPDLKVFNDINIPHEFFSLTMKRQSVVNAGITFILRMQEEDGSFLEEKYYYENGISDYINEITEGNSLVDPKVWHLETQGRDREDKKDYKLKADIAFCVSNHTNCREYYHNSSFLEYGGAPEKAVRAGFQSAIDQYIKKIGGYKKNEDKIGFDDISDCLVVIINSASTKTSYENQTKKAINNPFIAKALTHFIKAKLEIYFAENPTDGTKFVNQVLINKRSRENAEKARIDIKKKLSGSVNLANRVEKFVDCRSKDAERRELYIVEGDSALSSCKEGRDAEFQAIIPVRGKTLNCMKSSYSKIFESKIIVDLLRVIGCGVEIDGKVKGDLVSFDYNALRWSKIIICTDADEDGFQIRTLLLTLFYRLLPTLLQKNKVFIAESPLFEISCGNDTYFAYNEQEKAEILKKLEGKKYIIQRSKGLGENEPDMMWQTTMNPATRRLVAVSPADAQQTEWMFDVLMGENLKERKRFIAENGSRYVKDADV